MGTAGFAQTLSSALRHTRMPGTLVPDSTRPPSRPGRPDNAPLASLALASLALDSTWSTPPRPRMRETSLYAKYW